MKRQDTPLVVSFGGGVNSAAMLVGMKERGICPDLILFADTGGEKPETYRFIQTIRAWLVTQDSFPDLVVVQNDGMHGTLERECLTNHTMPSLVFGWRSCSEKYKLRPQKKYAASIYGDRQLTWAIGIDAGESHRMGAFENCWHPLVEWGWHREECVAAIRRANLPVPLKSACFFCPASKKSEVLRLKREHPDLFTRAVAMKSGALGLDVVRGLGRHWSWGELARADEAQFKMFEDRVDTPCMCFDGEGQDAALLGERPDTPALQSSGRVANKGKGGEKGE